MEMTERKEIFIGLRLFSVSVLKRNVARQSGSYL